MVPCQLTGCSAFMPVTQSSTYSKSSFLPSFTHLLFEESFVIFFGNVRVEIVPSFLLAVAFLGLSTFLHSLASAVRDSFMMGLIASIPDNFWVTLEVHYLYAGWIWHIDSLTRLVYLSATVSIILAYSTASLRFASDSPNSFYREINQTRIIQSWPIEVRGWVYSRHARDSPSALKRLGLWYLGPSPGDKKIFCLSWKFLRHGTSTRYSAANKVEM